MICLPRDFYPRSPCGERLVNPYKLTMIFGFLSTLSLRRATCLRCCAISCITISIHALLAESDNTADQEARKRLISIHALLAESDCECLMALNRPLRFLSTLSLRRATANGCTTIPNCGNFYPRSPCGERHLLRTIPRIATINFYPRSPCGERRTDIRNMRSVSNFYPRSPCGERL